MPLEPGALCLDVVFLLGESHLDFLKIQHVIGYAVAFDLVIYTDFLDEPVILVALSFFKLLLDGDNILLKFFRFGLPEFVEGIELLYIGFLYFTVLGRLEGDLGPKKFLPLSGGNF